MQGLIIHGKKLCLYPKSSGSHGRVKQNGEIGLQSGKTDWDYDIIIQARADGT